MNTIRAEIITGLNDNPRDLVVEVIVEAATAHGLGVTFTFAQGFHPDWGGEPVAVITTYLDEDDARLGGHQDFAEALRAVFDQDAVVLATSDASMSFVERPNA